MCVFVIHVCARINPNKTKSGRDHSDTSGTIAWPVRFGFEALNSEVDRFEVKHMATFRL